MAITLGVVAFLLVLVVQVVILVYVRSALTDAESEPVDEEPPANRRTETAGLVGRLRRSSAEQHARTVREVEALIDLRALVPARTTMPSTQGWAASPLTVSALVREVLDTKPRLVVEVGSGGMILRIADDLECEREIVGAERRAVVPLHALTDAPGRFHAPVGQHPPESVLYARHGLGQHGPELAGVVIRS